VLVSFLVGLRTYQHPGTDSVDVTAVRQRGLKFGVVRVWLCLVFGNYNVVNVAV